MTTNSPNPVDGDVQALIADCQAEIKHIEHLLGWKNPNEYSDKSLKSKLLRQQAALAALTAEPVAWIVMAPQGDYIERNPDVVAHLEGTGLAKCKPLYDAPPAQLLRPVELPEPYDDGHGNLWLPQDAVIAAIKNASGEVKS